MRPAPVRSTRRVRVAAIACGVLCELVALVGAVAHFRTPHRPEVLGVSAFAPYLLLAAPLALALVAAVRQWLLAIAAVALCGVWIATQAPLYIAASAPAHARSVVAMTSNLRVGSGSAADVVSAVSRHHVDLLMLEELTADEQARLVAAGLDEQLPYHLSSPSPAATGTGLWSRYPIQDGDRRTDFAFAFITARVAIPGVPLAPTVVALHMAGPWPDSALWLHDIARLPGVLRALGATPASVIVGGDFNATPDIAQFRTVLAAGYADAARQAGAGLTATYPSDRWFGPLIAIDHVLTRHAVATSAVTVEIDHSDHRALVTTVAIPTG